MAKTKGPLLSLDAHGSLGRVLTYSHRKSGRQVRKYTKPLVAASPKQRGQRRLTEFLVAQWQNMSAGDKATWEANARLSGPHITGYHFFLRETQRDLYTHTGLVGYWHCNEIVGGKVLDLSGNANHGTLEPGYPANAPILTPSWSTRFSNALLYDGVDEYVDCGTAESLSPSNLSIEVWGSFFADAVGAFISKRTAVGENDEYNLLYHKAQHRIEARIAGKYGEAEVAFKPFTPTIKQRYCFTITFDGTKVKLYIDDIKGTDGTPGVGITNQGISCKIGCLNSGTYHFPGIIDEISFYNRVFSDGERSTRYRFAMREVD